MKFKKASLVIGILGVLFQPILDLLLFRKFQTILYSSHDIIESTQITCSLRTKIKICLTLLMAFGMFYGIKQFKNNKVLNIVGILLCLISLALCILPFMTFVGDTTLDFRVHC